MKRIFLLLSLFMFLFSNAQELQYVKNGIITDADGTKLKPSEIRALVENQSLLLEQYNSARNSRNFGNIFMGIGLGLTAGDLIKGLTAAVEYPTILTYLGLTTFTIGGLAKIGFTKKFISFVDEYNKTVKNDRAIQWEELNFLANQNGVGISITF